MSIALIEEQALKLVQQLRSVTQAKVNLWQQIPNLCLEADGRSGFSRDLGICYATGCWHLGGSDSYFYVDCATGEIVHRTLQRNAPTVVLVSDEKCLWLLGHTGMLDAARIIGHLSDAATSARPSFYTSKAWDETEAQRIESRARYGLGYNIPYVRT